MRLGPSVRKHLSSALTVSGAVAVALLCSAAALAAHPKAGGHYSGATGQVSPLTNARDSMSFDVSMSGGRVIHPKLFLNTACNTGYKSWAQTSSHKTATASATIKNDGKFSLHFHEKATIGAVVAHATFTVHGHFVSSTEARSTASVTINYSNGGVCKAHSVHFTLTG